MYNLNNIQDNTVAQLKQICRDYDIWGFSRLRKAELIELVSNGLEKYNKPVYTIEQFKDKYGFNFKVGSADDKYFMVADKDGFMLRIDESDYYTQAGDTFEDRFTGEIIDGKRGLEALYDANEEAKQEYYQTRGGAIPYVRSLEELLLLPPTDFKLICDELNVQQEELEYIGEFYVRVWEVYNQDNPNVNSERQSQQRYDEWEENTKGEYSIYQDHLDLNQIGDDIEPFTDYEFYHQDETIIPTRSYSEWRALEHIRSTIESVFNSSPSYEDEEMPF